MSTKVTNLLKDAAKPFTPSEEQRIIKARLHQTLSERSFAVDVESLTMEQLVGMTGDKRMEKWAKDSPAFLSWLLDKDVFKFRAQAYAEIALEQLYSILVEPIEDKLLTAKDKIAAANLILQIADRFPNKRKEMVWLDKDVGRLSEEDTDRKILEYKKKLITIEASSDSNEEEG